MTIIEGLKELRLIEKKILDNTKRIEKYASQPSSEKPLMRTAEDQAREVKGLAQANEDLAQRYASLHADIAYTNLEHLVEINKEKKSIHEWLQYRRKLCGLIEATYQAMNDTNARVSVYNRSSDVTVHIERHYDEKAKQEKLREWMEIHHAIDSRLEVVNATTELRNFFRGGVDDLVAAAPQHHKE